MTHREAAVSSDQARVEVDVASSVQRRIAHDLHDGVSQLLVGAALMANNLLEQAPPALRPDLGRLVKLLEEATARVQSIARGLSPLHLGKLGLGAALRAVCAAVEAQGSVQCSLALDPSAETQTEETVVELCLIAQEAMHNAVRHGRARHIDLRLERLGDDACLSIDDDGSGLQSPGTGAGLGLESMSLRARRLGGSFEIAAREQGGTRVRCVWPTARTP